MLQETEATMKNDGCLDNLLGNDDDDAGDYYNMLWKLQCMWMSQSAGYCAWLSISIGVVANVFSFEKLAEAVAVLRVVSMKIAFPSLYH
jgi:hypothetical protein